MYKYHEQFYYGYGRMYILINIVFAETYTVSNYVIVLPLNTVSVTDSERFLPS